ncbi:biliverdin-producing heme oxygenase [Ottowia sp.]|uniref:biliverdin-producing heme oxygenase n=1 Tax=Ottowia sp. TaxID=1898956 RepID=UPI002C88E672|nr:biliverdin-producing heme oxygenase [Ottowia sp.]HRN75847.1 biliverdin-producing heme oxygenase [Ottowia sp.]HRQ03191.1 biliverdin-producing heme oxygenase [Ottowia sp.]
MSQSTSSAAAAAASGRCGMRERLRGATAERHAQVDRRMPLARAAPDLRDYLRHLCILRDWLHCRVSAAPQLARLDTVIAQRHSIERDAVLAARLVGQPLPEVRMLDHPAPARRAVPDVESNERAAFDTGTRYVIEGAALGGQVMYRRLHQALAPHPLEHLRGGGAPEVAARWRAFLAELEAGPWSPALAAAACHGAQAAFDCLLKRIDAEAEVALP